MNIDLMILNILLGALGSILVFVIIDRINKHRIHKFFFQDNRTVEEMQERFLVTLDMKKILRKQEVHLDELRSVSEKEIAEFIKFFYKHIADIKFQIEIIQSHKGNLIFETIDKMFVIFNDFKLATIKNNLVNRRYNFEIDRIQEIEVETSISIMGKAEKICLLLLDIKFFIEYYDEFLKHFGFPKRYLKQIRIIKYRERIKGDKISVAWYEELEKEITYLMKK